jgi:methylglutaconyl-CoA hydratase
VTVAGATGDVIRTRRGAALWLLLNRPDARNALTPALVEGLYEGLAEAAGDARVRAIVMTGAGAAFCAGADLKNPPGAAPGARSLADVLAAILDCPKPVIAAVNGAAFAGGLGLVAAADIAITVEDAAMSFSEVRIGVIPAIISVVCIPKLGPGLARKLFVTGERFTGADAVRFGLAHEAVARDKLEAAVDAAVAMIAEGAPGAVAECKALVARVTGLPPTEGFAIASAWSLARFNSAEAAEGMAAFREKRRPAWALGASRDD